MSSLDWMDDALCRQVGQELFFPDKGANPAPAVAVCRRCSVQEPCLSYALEAGGVHGVWGGTTEAQRRRLRRTA